MLMSRTHDFGRERPAMTVLVAPSGFKESIGPEEAAEHIAAGVLRAQPDARVLKAPIADGGEGFTRAMVNATGGSMHRLAVTGPTGHRIESFLGFLGGAASGTAVIEMAAAAGLRLVPRSQRNPMLTSSYGVGELIRAALDAGARRILLGCGDSGTNDGGAGMVQALGARLLDAQGRELGRGGAELLRLQRIELDELDGRLRQVRLEAAVNWHNVLLGPRCVTRMFGRQKGATTEQVLLLEEALRTYARCIRDATGIDIGDRPGSGASGGLGSGFAALLGGTLLPRYQVVTQYLDIDGLIEQSDLVVTAEGMLDDRTPLGKVPVEVARRARKRGVPVIALAGSIGSGVNVNFEHGIDAFTSILERPCTLEEAIHQAGPLLTRAAEDALRMIGVGLAIAGGGRVHRALAAT